MDIRKDCRHYYNDTGAASATVHSDSVNLRPHRWGRRDGGPNFTRLCRNGARVLELSFLKNGLPRQPAIQGETTGVPLDHRRSADARTGHRKDLP
jgi:hypothetical protein